MANQRRFALPVGILDMRAPRCAEVSLQLIVIWRIVA